MNAREVPLAASAEGVQGRAAAGPDARPPGRHEGAPIGEMVPVDEVSDHSDDLFGVLAPEAQISFATLHDRSRLGFGASPAE